MNIQHLINIVARSAIYIQQGCEGIRIDYYETETSLEEGVAPEEMNFYGTGEESGESYQIAYSEINLAEDMFYELKLVDIVEA